MPADELTDRARQVHVLACGEIDIEGRMPWSSNATFLVNVSCGDQTAQAIYKPLRGERPLWDFEPGLHRREVAAYHLSEALDLDLVPPTVLRDGPYGEGSLQWFVDVDHRQHYFTIHEERPDLHDTLRGVAMFDLLANNTDRKSGHVLIDSEDHIWGIDHGLCFSADFKLRTVVWEFGGEPIDRQLVDAARRIADRVPLEVATLLADDEIKAMQKRAGWLAENPVFPVDQSGRRYPWPMV
ncbi:MAG TPA: SCO1664 family protein [Ilumatobacteraceae bacterium]|nr:SCO1664 family protein [Ilumatobacteraceae bacterium]